MKNKDRFLKQLNLKKSEQNNAKLCNFPSFLLLMKVTGRNFPFYVLSLLPRKVLHELINLLFFILYPLITYRKKTVFSNLQLVFKNNKRSDLKRLQKKFYRQFLKNFEELIPLLSQSKESIKKSSFVENPEIVTAFKHLKTPILLTTAHTGNWEKAFSILPLFIDIPTGLIYTPVKNTFFSGILTHIRSRFGLMLISRYHFKQHLIGFLNQSFIYIMPSDQRPVHQMRSFKTNFLGIETNFLYGVEKNAAAYDLPVIFMHIKDDDGMCRIKFTLISRNGKETEHGFITRTYAELLEKQIYDDPEQWLWSHRRWKDQA